MRKITTLAISAFMNGESFKSGNTKVSPANNDTYLYLHDSIIAIRNHVKGRISVTSAGWRTNTTKERLNGIPDVSITQKNFQWYLNGEKWDGSLKTV